MKLTAPRRANSGDTRERLESGNVAPDVTMRLLTVENLPLEVALP